MDDRTPTVLIVDDDPQILHLVERMLRPRRCNVLVAPRPADALTICERERVDLLISDVRMPEMDGPKLAERVIALLPDVSILLMSGYAKEAPRIGKAGQVLFLKKPFFPSDLMMRLRELLPES